MFNQLILPSYLSAYSASVLVFYGLVVYTISTQLRSGLVPQSYTIFIVNAVTTTDIMTTDIYCPIPIIAMTTDIFKFVPSLALP